MGLLQNNRGLLFKYDFTNPISFLENLKIFAFKIRNNLFQMP